MKKSIKRFVRNEELSDDEKWFKSLQKGNKEPRWVDITLMWTFIGLAGYFIYNGFFKKQIKRGIIYIETMYGGMTNEVESKEVSNQFIAPVDFTVYYDADKTSKILGYIKKGTNVNSVREISIKISDDSYENWLEVEYK